MRKVDTEVREVVCAETGKPMPKIPLWMADVKVKFISEEAKQKHPSTGIADLEPLRRSIAASGDLDEIKADVVGLDDDVDEMDEIGDDAAMDDLEE